MVHSKNTNKMNVHKHKNQNTPQTSKNYETYKDRCKLLHIETVQTTT